MNSIEALAALKAADKADVFAARNAHYAPSAATKKAAAEARAALIAAKAQYNRISNAEIRANLAANRARFEGV